jgi:hypothetical protein
LKVGDTIEITCPRFQSNTTKSISGKITELFDVLHKDGSTGNFEIDIVTPEGKWYRYKPSTDGGTYNIKETK